MQMLRITSSLVDLYYFFAKYKEAEKFADKSLKICSAILQPNDPLYAVHLDNLAK